ncbi:MAG: putative metal-dependent hydrolase [Saprospiraceae bacterium]|nr:putative metal-dependent hydrolase [Saprospiraceae bacterium]
MEALRYPLGKFKFPKSHTKKELANWIRGIKEFPGTFRTQVDRMTPADLDTPYRAGGWTGRQVIHHVPDSHLNAYCRFKLTLTEEKPSIKPYLEHQWATLPDTGKTDVSVSMDLLEALHVRWLALLENLSNQEWNRAYVHPEYGNEWPLWSVAALYAWHGEHHLAHLKLIRP